MGVGSGVLVGVGVGVGSGVGVGDGVSACVAVGTAVAVGSGATVGAGVCVGVGVWQEPGSLPVVPQWPTGDGAIPFYPADWFRNRTRLPRGWESTLSSGYSVGWLCTKNDA